MNKVKLFLLLLIFCGAVLAQKGIHIPEIIDPKVMQIANNHLFITDGMSVYIYTMDDFRLKKRFGQKGEGPGDFLSYNFLVRDVPSIGVKILPKKIFVGSLQKVSFFSKDGSYLSEVKFRKESMTVDMSPFGKNYIGKALDYKPDKNIYYTFRIYDSGLNEIKDICSHPFNRLILKKEKEFAVINNRIYISGKEGFSIDIYNQNGDLFNTISKHHKRIKFKKLDKKKVLKWYEEDSFYKKQYEGDEIFWKKVKEKLNNTDLYPSFRSFMIANDKIYMETYKHQDNKTEFLIFTINGEFLKPVYLPLEFQDMFKPYTYTISENKLFQLVEKNEKHELHITKIK